MGLKTETLDTLANVGSKVTAAGATTSVVGTFVLQNITGLLGVLIALIGVLINVHYKRKADKRRELEARLNVRATEQTIQQRAEMFQLRMELMRRGISVGPPSDFAPLAPQHHVSEEDDDR